MLKRTKPGLVSTNSSARLLEDVLADRDNYDHLIQGSRVRQQNLYSMIKTKKKKKMLTAKYIVVHLLTFTHKTLE